MKKLILLICFGIICSIAGNTYNWTTLYIPYSPPMKPYQALWEAVCTVESSGYPMAVGDKHLKDKSYGIAQIRQVRLDDYYLQTGIRYTTTQMFDTTRSKSVFMWYASKYNPSDIEQISRCWNGGINGMKKRSTKKYYKKILKYL